MLWSLIILHVVKVTTADWKQVQEAYQKDDKLHPFIRPLTEMCLVQDVCSEFLFMRVLIDLLILICQMFSLAVFFQC